MRSAALAAAVLVLAATPAHAGKFHYSHRFVATGHLVDHWAVDNPDDCGAVGEGTVTVDFTSAKPSKAKVVIDPSHNGEPNNTLGSWTLLAPGDAFGHITDIGSKPARSEEHTSELQSHSDLVCRLLLEKKKKKERSHHALKKKKKKS